MPCQKSESIIHTNGSCQQGLLVDDNRQSFLIRVILQVNKIAQRWVIWFHAIASFLLRYSSYEHNTHPLSEWILHTAF
jgi:hypothetical protein